MADTIKDGTGAGYLAEVDSTFKLNTRSATQDSSFEALRNGNHYAITSTPITMTGTSANAMLYFQNDGEKPLIIDRIIFNTDDSTGGTVDQFIVTITFNPTGLTSGSGSDVVVVNTNLGSSNGLTLTSERGADGATVDGGTSVGAWRIENPTRNRIQNIRWYMPKGSSVAISYTPPASNTSMVGIVALNVHVEPGDI